MIKNSQTGFALLLTIVVVSIVVTIGLSLLEGALKQISLSSTGRDSEKAFHASYAGIECARYWVNRDIDMFMVESVPANPAAVPPTPARAFYLGGIRCFHNVTWYQSVYTEEVLNRVHHSYYAASWGPDRDICSAMDVFIFDATAGSDVTYNIVQSDVGNKTCPAGNKCTYILSRGYNRSCAQVDSSLRTIQREVIMEF